MCEAFARSSFFFAFAVFFFLLVFHISLIDFSQETTTRKTEQHAVHKHTEKICHDANVRIQTHKTDSETGARRPSSKSKKRETVPYKRRRRTSSF
jgi:hypothetical protein